MPPEEGARSAEEVPRPSCGSLKTFQKHVDASRKRGRVVGHDVRAAAPVARHRLRNGVRGRWPSSKSDKADSGFDRPANHESESPGVPETPAVARSLTPARRGRISTELRRCLLAREVLGAKALRRTGQPGHTRSRFGIPRLSDFLS